MSFLDLIRSSRGLRPEKRSTALVSIAQSLGTIASALKIITLKQYGVDLDQPPTRADREREVFEPLYPDNEREAIMEEIERVRAMEAEWQVGSSSSTKSPTRRSLGALTTASAARGEELTPEEREFLNELGSGEEL